MNTLNFKALFFSRLPDISMAVRIAWTAVAILALGVEGVALWQEGIQAAAAGILVAIGGLFASLPAAAVMAWTLPRLARRNNPNGIFPYLLQVAFFAVLPYGLFVGIVVLLVSPGPATLENFLFPAAGVSGALFVSLALASVLQQQHLMRYIYRRNPGSTAHLQNSNMDTVQSTERDAPLAQPQQRFMIKGLVTGALILLLLIPTLFINNLVHEREKRQKTVAEEVSQKWSAAQTFSGPYLYVPYRHYEKDKEGKIAETRRAFWILPEELSVDGQVNHEVRKRSIYQVLLYRADLKVKGQFIPQVPRDIDPANLIWQDARLCVGITDFKGIEEKIVVQLQGQSYELTPGLPEKTIDKTGLSAPLNLGDTALGKAWNFDTRVKLKGSEQLHFKPMSGNSKFTLSSSWPSPSFDGNSLPGEKAVHDSGFRATWTFNKANLPFNTVLRDFNMEDEAVAFGVTLLQPADNYAKTERSVKYAILFIGLTFSLFFIVEILQKKPVHPVQYVLIGMALVIFYTLLLSISEFMAFDQAYLISGTATILLVTLYAWSHFRKFSTAALFGAVLSMLYGFIFILIRLEDTALLVGSIALFLVLALVMYASRKIQWYGPENASNG